MVRIDLLEEFSARLPAGAPNRFLVNVAENEREGILSELAGAGAVTSDFYPMVRWRLTHIADAVGEGARSGREGVDRELNFTTTTTLPAENKQVVGKWISGPGEVSVDSELAKRLDIKLGICSPLPWRGAASGPGSPVCAASSRRTCVPTST